jgi:cysteine desulfurase/selenocysteine lyase
LVINKDREDRADIPRTIAEAQVTGKYQGYLKDLDGIRQRDFPLLDEEGRTYLDNAATTQEPQSVKDRMHEYRRTHIRGSSHSRNSKEAREVQSMYDEARGKVVDFFGARNFHVAFTSGTTGSSNFLATRFPFKKGDTQVITYMEHNSQIVTARNFAKKAGARVEYVPLSSREGRLDLEELQRIANKAKGGKLLLNLVHASNFSGVINPVSEIREILGDRGLIYLDMAQSAGRMPIDLDALDVDFAGVSAHKMYGPMGIGAVFINTRSERFVSDDVSGGSAIDMVSKAFTVPADRPDRYEPGTQDLEGAIEWGFAIDYLKAIGMEAIHAHERGLGQYFLGELKKIDGVRIYGPKDFKDRVAVISFNVGSYTDKTYDRVAREMDERGISVRDGCQCAHIYAAQLIGLPRWGHEGRALARKAGVSDELYKFLGAVRVSFAFYNDLGDAQRAIRAIEEVASMVLDAKGK